MEQRGQPVSHDAVQDLFVLALEWSWNLHGKDLKCSKAFEFIVSLGIDVFATVIGTIQWPWISSYLSVLWRSSPNTPLTKWSMFDALISGPTTSHVRDVFLPVMHQQNFTHLNPS